MATVCDTCGNRTNEVKSGGGIEPKGVKIEVDVKVKRDLTRDVLKVLISHSYTSRTLLINFLPVGDMRAIDTRA